jgi:hypothetical protein
VFDPAYEYLSIPTTRRWSAHPRRNAHDHPAWGRGDPAYRRLVSDAMAALLTKGDNRIDQLVELGIHHEQQHQGFC